MKAPIPAQTDYRGFRIQFDGERLDVFDLQGTVLVMGLVTLEAAKHLINLWLDA